MSALSLVWLEIALPLASFLLLAVLGKRMPRWLVVLLGVGSVGAAAVVAVVVSVAVVAAGPAGAHGYTLQLWQWMRAGGFSADVALYVDALAVVMSLVVTWVGFFIHLYSVEFMAEDDGFSRFFAYMNLFVASMLILVLGDNLLLLYLGWEGVGLCSFLLIGFWYREPENALAARKAFIVTRVGDTAMAVGLLLIATQLGTLEIQEAMARAAQRWPEGSAIATTAAFLLVGGAVGKSAQLPLQTWLPDAMAGPSPVSALIHAATMVTAGVYLIARTNPLFALSPAAMLAVAFIGAVTLLVAGFSGLVQWDIKRVLAYSTISQIGYMFLGLGVGAWAAAIFHLMVHAFFKSLLFLGAGAVIHAMHHEHDIRRMGGLRRELPVTFWTFLVGAAALAGFPLVTAGFYSKDLILTQVWTSERGGVLLWLLAFTGVLLTALYTFRMVFIAFFGEARGHVDKRPGWVMLVPLVVLAILSVVAGGFGIPATLGGYEPLRHFLEVALRPATGVHETSLGTEAALQAAASAVSLLGIFLAYWWFVRRRRERPEAYEVPLAPAWLRGLWRVDWGFDHAYDTLFVRPYVWFANANRGDVIDLVYGGIAGLARLLHRGLQLTQSGLLRWYATGIALGAVLILTLVVFM